MFWNVKTWQEFRKSERKAGLIGLDRIHEADVLRSDQLMLYEYGGWHRFLVQDGESQWNDLLTITFREVSHRTDQSRSRPSEFAPSVTYGVLSHHRAQMIAS